MKKRIVMFLAAASAAMCAFAVPEVTDVVAKQRYPWNGLVDITCKVSGINGTTNGLKFAVAAVMPDSGVVCKVYQFWVVKDGVNSTGNKVQANGNYKLLWDAQADLGGVIYSNMLMRVTVVDHDKVQLWESGPYWATANIGAEKPEEYGWYFWWGDTVGYRRENNAWVASDGSSSNFSFGSGNSPTMDKDISTLQSEGWIVSQYGTYVLAPSHDAAHVQWGGDWRMPTKQDLSSLDSKCDWKRTSVNGVSGYEVRGRGVYASNSIFLPIAGNCYGTSYFITDWGFYWSSVPRTSTDNSTYSECFLFKADLYVIKDIDIRERCYGLSIRPVQGFTGQAVNVTFDGNGGTPSSSSRSYKAGNLYGTLPDATRQGYGFDGWFTAASGGTQVTGRSSVSETVTILYAHWTAGHSKVQLWESGPYWATTNIGAEKPEEYGWYFWWGDTVGYRRENNAWVASDGSSSNFSFGSGNSPTMDKDISTLQSEGWIVSQYGTYVLAPSHDAAHVQWGGDWRMPTEQELRGLYNKCDWKFKTVNGVNGYEFRGRGIFASNSIFLPCAGSGYGTSLGDAGSYGLYWSSVPYSGSNDSNAWDLRFYSGDHGTNIGYRRSGRSVRPVQGFAK